jgi:hypothetical protein
MNTMKLKLLQGILITSTSPAERIPERRGKRPTAAQQRKMAQ